MMAFFLLLPIYLLGNLHCAGMCGPLVMLLAKHPYRWAYFLGRSLSFAFAGLLSAEMGMTLFTFLSRYHISSSFSLLFGIWIALLGLFLLFRIRLPASQWLGRRGAELSATLGRLMAQNSFYAVFLFGFCTLVLPCGQTILVFSIIALNCSPLGGLLNGFLFALFTSPALIAAMRASHFFSKQQKGYHMWMGGAALMVGLLAILRGCADFEWIEHLILNPSSPAGYHIVFF
jgi:uncharacterized protein